VLPVGSSPDGQNPNDSNSIPGGADQTVCARLESLSKAFGETQATRGVDLELRTHEVHALLGENGAGKTTLMHMLAGIVVPDAGELVVGGETVRLNGRMDGARLGIGLVQQHYGLVEELTGIENYLLGHPHAGAWLNQNAGLRELRNVANELGLQVNLNRRVGDLTIGERQRLEILIALTTGADILILDEPTAALGSADVEVLGRVLTHLKQQGKCIVYITHKLDEVFEFADRVTVMRRGEVVAQFQRAALDRDKLTEALVGSLPTKKERQSTEVGQPVIELRDVSVDSKAQRRGLEQVSLAARGGEIVGVAGVLGNGQEALAQLLTGIVSPSRGTIDPRPAAIAYIPEDRATDGLAASLTLTDNAIIHRHRDAALQQMGALSSRRTRAYAARLVADGNVLAENVDAAAATLSGGNQQKLVVAREFDRSPDLIVAHNPYRGLDVGATLEVRERLLDARNAGRAVVLISPDLEDLFDISDRIVVLSGGRLIGEIDPHETTMLEVGALLGGVAS